MNGMIIKANALENSNIKKMMILRLDIEIFHVFLFYHICTCVY